ncbi:MAG: mechanosensitive ion channel domain-containing protein [Woeseiaceae bacterium]
MLDQITSLVSKYGQLVIDYLSAPIILMQLGAIGILIVPAFLLGRQTRPFLEDRARGIKGMPGLLRLVVTLLHRLALLYFVILLGAAYVTTTVIAWPESNQLIKVALLLSAAWLAISIVAHGLRNRMVGRIFGLFAWIYVAAAILGVVDDTAQVLDSAGFGVGDFRISILSILKALLLLGLALWLSNTLGNYLERRIQKLDELTPSLRVLLGKTTRILLFVIAASVVISGLGIDLTALTVLSGALGVGIGFGLQKVVSNFISGIIILVDQSIKPGDTISLGDTFGWIRELRSRFISVVTRDGREYLIPNEDFITQRVINWSFSDRYVRLDVDFGVSYDSDPHEVTRIAIEAASGVGRVDATHRAPVCWMTEFGESSINFVLRFWISDPQEGLTNIRGKVLLALWDAFKENNIKIPYPHRQLIMDSPVPVTSVPDGPVTE